MSKIQIYEQGDCMVLMEKYKDVLLSHNTLAIVDPPYGINIVDQFNKTTKSKSSMFKLSKGGDGYNFDENIPDKEYFDLLKRVSENQIIWGGNYFLDYFGNTKCFLIWDKMNGTNPMADAELAYCTIQKSVKMFRMHHFSSGYDSKIHINQKPKKLYKWIIDNFLDNHTLILDTHVGSASSLIAYEEAGLNYIGFELDEDYYKQSKQRLEKARFEREAKKSEKCVTKGLALFDDNN